MVEERNQPIANSNVMHIMATYNRFLDGHASQESEEVDHDFRGMCTLLSRIIILCNVLFC